MCFNPLDRGNLNQIIAPLQAQSKAALNKKFQSPRSGKFESNKFEANVAEMQARHAFQSPRSGKFESNVSCSRSTESNRQVSIP